MGGAPRRPHRPPGPRIRPPHSPGGGRGVMDLTSLETLREKLGGAREFADVWRYFLDHFGEDPAFIDLGEADDDPLLESVIVRVGEQLFGREEPLQNWVLRRLPGQGFVHGSGPVHGAIAGVLYFEADRAGLLAVVVPPE